MPRPTNEYPDGTKKCSACSLTKPLAQFRMARRPDGTRRPRGTCQCCETHRDYDRYVERCRANGDPEPDHPPYCRDCTKGTTPEALKAL